MAVPRKFTVSDIITLFTSDTVQKNVDLAMTYIFQELNLRLTDIQEGRLTELKTKIGNLYKKCNQKWQKASRNRIRFENQNSDWLQLEFKVFYLFIYYVVYLY